MMRDYCQLARNDSAVLSATAFTKIADVNHKRSYFYVCSVEGKICINFCPGENGEKGKGIQLKTGDSWVMPTDALYTGEICACGVEVESTISILEY